MQNFRRLNTAVAVSSAFVPTPGPQRSPSDHSAADRMLELLRAGGDLRQRKVRRVKAAVRVRAYENNLKLAIAVERMKQDL